MESLFWVGGANKVDEMDKKYHTSVLSHLWTLSSRLSFFFFLKQTLIRHFVTATSEVEPLPHFGFIPLTQRNSVTHVTSLMMCPSCIKDVFKKRKKQPWKTKVPAERRVEITDLRTHFTMIIFVKYYYLWTFVDVCWTCGAKTTSATLLAETCPKFLF